MQDQTAVLLTTSPDEHAYALDIEVASAIFATLTTENPQLRHFVVVEGSLVHALEEGVIEVHKVT